MANRLPLPRERRLVGPELARDCQQARAAGGLDVLHEISAAKGSVGCAQLRQDAAQLTVQGRTFLVASLADITASKQVARRPKDLEALPELQRLLDDPTARARDAKHLTDVANAQRGTSRRDTPAATTERSETREPG